MKYILILSLLFIGCERRVDRRDQSKRYDIICIDGFEFYERLTLDTRSLANRLDKDGKPVPCKKL